MLETLDYTIRIGSTPTFLYFDLYLYSAYAAHYVYFNPKDTLLPRVINNLLAILSIVKGEGYMEVATNLFILSQAIADFLVCIPRQPR